MKTLFFHIGSPKTGTTYIQNCLAFSRKSLAAKNIYYHQIADSECANHWWFAIPFVTSPADYYPYELDIKRGVSRDSLKERGNLSDSAFREAVENDEILSIILSAEQFLYLPKPALSLIKNYFDTMKLRVEVICYNREPVAYATSEINQKVKMGLGDLDDLLRNPPTAGYDCMKLFVELFGRGACNFRSYEIASQHKHGILGDFCDVIGCNYSDISIPRQPDVNKSLSEISLRLINKINPLIDFPPHTPKRDALLQCLIELDKEYSNAPFTLPANTIEILHMKCRAQLDWIRDELGIAVDLQDFPRKST